ncbi:hypothetical protein BYT27DRAFT_7254780 [Phlegmacium glaucopus]|nr:hypothetical protein BYT27DRAFT_7254780 [Phlegmacium glaucopus]
MATFKLSSHATNQYWCAIAVLKATLVNLSGHVGAFTLADMMQEFFNQLLEAIVEKKGVEYSDTFIRDVISRNLHHFARIKTDLREGVELGKRSGRHSVPHLNPEIRTLLQVYQDCETHSRRPGRVYEDTNKDDFQRGFLKLGGGGKLKKWIFDTTTTRDLAGGSCEESQSSLEHMELEENNTDNDLEAPPPLGYQEIVDGRLVFASMKDLVTDVDDMLAQMEDSNCIRKNDFGPR